MPLPTHYLVADRLLAGSYPGSPEAVQALERTGVTLFVDLTHPSDPLDRYEHLLDGTRRIGSPIPDFGTPTAGQVIRVLDEIDEARAQGGTVYVHCWGGVGRTGTVIGCWLVRHGLDDGDPIARIAELRSEIAGGRPSPETQGQVELVRGWRRGR
jgi:protein-tyrosine phosphatase